MIDPYDIYPFRMPDIRIVPLGAGQDVGRSCILVSIGNKNVMFDCGMHMGYNDERRFPDFNYIIGDQVFIQICSGNPRTAPDHPVLGRIDAGT